MAYQKRKIDAALEEWRRRKGHKPLVVKGARQTGKTESIRHFAASAYGNVVYINFVERPEFAGIVSEGYSVEAVVRNISQVDGRFRFEPNQTLIVFDEIQECPDVATAFKFFALDGRYDVVASGSLLGIHWKKIHSVSVGFQETIEMKSMDFEEFLWAQGRDGAYVEELLEQMVDGRAFPETTMEAAGRHFLHHCITGGMPAVVEQFARTGNFSGLAEMQREIVRAYRGDCGKYCEGLDAAKIRAVFDSVPGQLARENKKFQYAQIGRNARAREYGGCVEWLVDAGILSKCRRMKFPELPIRGNLDEDAFKLYVSDTGLLLAMLDEESAADFRVNRNFGTYRGGIAENIAAEAYAKAGKELAYYKREDSTLEEDFFLRTAKSLVPVEVKATRGTSKSLRTLIESKRYPDIRFGVKLHGGNTGIGKGIYTFPWFCAFLVPRFLSVLGK